MAESRLQVVGQETEPDVFPVETPKENKLNKIAGDVVLLALSTLSQRSIVALSNLFVLAAVGSAFVLWYVTPNPDAYQLIKLALYGIFLLGAIWVVKRRAG